jgi:capsule polysaccharide export protein KpsE/RkpR
MKQTAFFEYLFVIVVVYFTFSNRNRYITGIIIMDEFNNSLFLYRGTN